MYTSSCVSDLGRWSGVGWCCCWESAMASCYMWQVVMLGWWCVGFVFMHVRSARTVPDDGAVRGHHRGRRGGALPCCVGSCHCGGFQSKCHVSLWSSLCRVGRTAVDGAAGGGAGLRDAGGVAGLELFSILGDGQKICQDANDFIPTRTRMHAATLPTNQSITRDT